MIVFDQKNSLIVEKYDCMQIKARKPTSFHAIVRSLNGCSASFQCLMIINRSDFLNEIRYGKVKANNGLIDCSDHYTHMELVYGKDYN